MSLLFKQKCGNCKLYVPQTKTCRILHSFFSGKITPKDYCSQFKSHLEVCEMCGAQSLETFVEVTDSGVHIYCPNCILRS